MLLLRIFDTWVLIIKKSHLSLVAMATQAITVAAKPTTKPRMMIQPSDERVAVNTQN